MPAFLLSSAPGNNVSLPGLSLLTKLPDSNKTMSQAPDLTGSFADNLSASIASLVKVTESENSDITVDFAKLSASLEDLSTYLEELDPALFEDLRNFLNGQDLSPQGLENLFAGGKLPDFFASLQSNLDLESNMESLSELELSALDSSIAHISSLIQQQANVQEKDEAQNASVLPGFAFTIDKDGKIQLVHGNKTEQAQGEQQLKPSGQSISPLTDTPLVAQTSQSQAMPGQGISAQPAQAVQSSQNPHASTVQNQQPLVSANTVPLDQSLNAVSSDVVSEGDKSFNAHFELLKSDMPSDVADTLLDNGQELKEKLGIGGRFSEQQFKTLNESFKPYSTTLMTPVDAKEWADEVSQKIVWFTGRNIQAAEMHLNPADLGPIEVKINVQNDVASVSFNVQNASVRELLESNVVRLREMMESNGVNLGDVNVDSGNQDAYQEAQQRAQQMGAGQHSANGESGDDEVKTETVSVKSANIVDYFV